MPTTSTAGIAKDSPFCDAYVAMDKIIERLMAMAGEQSQAKKYVDPVKETFEGFLATRDEMSYPDWKRRLERARRESERGKRVTLDGYVKRRAQR
jgi:hypothetical protein